MKQVEERYISLREYEASKMAYRDIKNSVDTAKREGIAEGMEKEVLRLLRRCWQRVWMKQRLRK